MSKGERAFAVSGKGWADAESWHMLCDDLCGTSKDDRDCSDRPSSTRFLQLLANLKQEGQCVAQYVNSYIAHAALPHRRASLPEGLNLTLAKLWRAERAIVRAGSFISRCVVDGVELGGVPIPQFDQFEHLDRPFVTQSALSTMNQEWDSHSDEIRACRGWSWHQPLITEDDFWADEARDGAVCQVADGEDE